MRDNIISPRRREERVEYHLCYDTDPERGAGYWFPCNREGKVNVQKMPRAARRNYSRVRRMGVKPRLEPHRWSWMVPAVLRCGCGAEVELYDPMDNVCDKCNAIYNSSGQQVRCLARDVDYLDAGERYDDDY
jgi:hypothetical protein